MVESNCVRTSFKTFVLCDWVLAMCRNVGGSMHSNKERGEVNWEVSATNQRKA